MTARRLPSGGRIDRARALPFTWDGKVLNGHPGDTLASALLANDVCVVGRSFKYHRPRGVQTETWHHVRCRMWLQVERDTATHEIHAVRAAASPRRSTRPAPRARNHDRATTAERRAH